MTLNQLRYFVEVVRQKNFTKAAEQLFVSQSALSKAIKALETEYRVKLIDHTVRNFHLTPEGQIFYDYAARILDYVDTQTREVNQIFHDEEGILRIGMPPTAGSIFFYSVLKDFSDKFPDITLSLMENPSNLIYEEMRQNKLDMGVVLEPFENNGEYIVKRACTSKIALAVSVKNPLAQKDSVSIKSLKNEKVLLMSSDFMFHRIVVNACREHGVELDVAFESSQWDLVYELAAANKGVAFFPEILLEKHTRPDIKIVFLEQPEIPWILSIIYRKDKFLSFPMKAFLKACESNE